MGLFGGGNSAAAAAQSAAQLQMAEQEMDAITDLFNRLVSTCNKKCVPNKYRDGELTKGESVCIDRCVAKYMEAHDKIGKLLQEMNAQQGGQAPV
eukprot:Clim_evm6s22 gene=Clim_evmTU6s22